MSANQIVLGGKYQEKEKRKRKRKRKK